MRTDRKRVVTVTQRISACRDPKDDKFLDVALTGEAQVILTGDQDLLELHPFHGVEILRLAGRTVRDQRRPGVSHG